VRYQVVPIANAEDGNTGRQYFALECRAGIVVNAVGTAGDDYSPGMRQIFKRYLAREHFGRNSEFPYFTSYKVAILTTGIEYG
jgi:hypothetical protein